MRHYLENHKFYVLNEDAKLVYKVGEYETFHDCEGIHIHLELVAGWDYVTQTKTTCKVGVLQTDLWRMYNLKWYFSIFL